MKKNTILVRMAGHKIKASDVKVRGFFVCK